MVLGPVNVDYVSALTASVDEALLTFPTPYIKSKVQKRVGGKGVIAATAAHEEGFRTTLLASVGGSTCPDDDARFIEQELSLYGFSYQPRVAHGFSTARVFLAYFASNIPRLMICDNDAIFQLKPVKDDLTDFPDALFVSGYLALEQPSRDAVRGAINSANHSEVLTIIDLVPHDLVRHVGRETVVEFASNVSVLVMAPITLRHLFPNEESEDKAIANTYSMLGIRKQLLIMDKINGTILSYDGTQTFRDSIGPVARTAPASGAGERTIFRIASAILTSMRGHQQ